MSSNLSNGAVAIQVAPEEKLAALNAQRAKIIACFREEFPPTYQRCPVGFKPMAQKLGVRVESLRLLLSSNVGTDGVRDGALGLDMEAKMTAYLEGQNRFDDAAAVRDAIHAMRAIAEVVPQLHAGSAPHAPARRKKPVEEPAPPVLPKRNRNIRQTAAARLIASADIPPAHAVEKMQPEEAAEIFRLIPPTSIKKDNGEITIKFRIPHEHSIVLGKHSPVSPVRYAGAVIEALYKVGVTGMSVYDKDDLLILSIPAELGANKVKKVLDDRGINYVGSNRAAAR